MQILTLYFYHEHQKKVPWENCVIIWRYTIKIELNINVCRCVQRTHTSVWFCSYRASISCRTCLSPSSWKTLNNHISTSLFRLNQILASKVHNPRPKRTLFEQPRFKTLLILYLNEVRRCSVTDSYSRWKPAADRRSCGEVLWSARQLSHKTSRDCWTQKHAQ